MHKICNNKLPLLFQQRFNKIELVHYHQTRKLTNLNYFLPCVSKTAGQKKLEFRGAKLWNEIDEDIKHKTFNSFKKCFKEKIVSHYSLGFDSSGTVIKLMESSSTMRILMRAHSFFLSLSVYFKYSVIISCWFFNLFSCFSFYILNFLLNN